MEQSDDHTSTCHAHWMTDGDRTTTPVKLLFRNLERLGRHGGLGGESLIDFVNVHVTDIEATLLKRFRNSKSWTNTHDLWWHTSDSIGEQTALDRKSVLFCVRASGQKDTGSAVSELRGVACCGASTFLEDGLELAEPLEGGLLSETIVVVNSHLLLIPFLVFDDRCILGDLSLRPTHFVRMGRLLVTLKGHQVLCLTTDSIFGGHILRGFTWTNEHLFCLWMLKDSFGDLFVITEHEFFEEIVHRHTFDAASDATVNFTRGNLVCDGRHCLQA